MPTLDDVMRALQGVRRELAEVKAMLAQEQADKFQQKLVEAEGRIAPEDDMTDPVNHFELKKWRGPSRKGRKYSECEPEFLEMLVGTLLFIAEKEFAEGKAFRGKPAYLESFYKASLARRWALRNRERAPAEAAKPEAPKGNPFAKKAAPAPAAAPPPPPMGDADFDFGHNVKPPAPPPSGVTGDALLDDEDDLFSEAF